MGDNVDLVVEVQECPNTRYTAKIMTDLNDILYELRDNNPRGFEKEFKSEQNTHMKKIAKDVGCQLDIKGNEFTFNCVKMECPITVNRYGD